MEEIETIVCDSELDLQIYQNKVSCAALLDAISLFELLGVNWMMALRFQNWSHETHEHAYDEVRHTKIIQRLSRKIRWSLAPQEVLLENQLNYIFVTATEKYLENLSKRVFRLTYHHKTCDTHFAISSYALISFLIERRIMKIYPQLAKFAPLEEIREVARTIIADERSHLTLVTGKLHNGLNFAESTQEEIILLEKNLANKWISELNTTFTRLFEKD